MSIDTNYNPHFPARYKNPYRNEMAGMSSSEIGNELLREASVGFYMETEYFDPIAKEKEFKNMKSQSNFLVNFMKDKSPKAQEAKAQIGDIIRTYA